MQTAHGPLLPGIGMVDLDKRFFQADGLKFFRTKETAEKTARVGNGFSL